MRTYDLLRKSVRHGAYAPCTPTPIQPMAIYHASTKHVTRSAGRSAVAAAAYRGGCALTDDRTGLVHDYTRKGGVLLSELVMPDGQAVDRGQLWSAAELAEKRKDARTAREWVVALPAELDKDQRAELARSFAVGLTQRYGVAVDLAVHEPSRHGSDKNHHAHLLTTTRKVSRLESGKVALGEKAHIEHSDKARRAAGLGSGADEVKEVRQIWESMANAALARAGQEIRIDARSLKDQGADREATIHLGPKASEMERRGTGSDRGDQNRTVEANNQTRAELVAKVAALQAEQARIAASQEYVRKAVAAEQARRDAAARQDAERQETARQEMARQTAAQQEQADKLAVRQSLIQDEHRYERLLEHQRKSVHARVAILRDRALGRRARRHDHEENLKTQEPRKPTGLFAGLKLKSYEAAHKGWQVTMDRTTKLKNQAWDLCRMLEPYRSVNEEKLNPFKLAREKVAKLHPELTKRVEAFRQQQADEKAREKAQAETRLNAEKARSFREDKPLDSARKYPDLVNAHLWFAAAMQKGASELPAENMKQFEDGIRESIARKIENGEPFKPVMVAEPVRRSFTQAESKSQDKGSDIGR